MLCCPMTTQIKNYPFEVLTGDGAVLADQIRNLDWRSRKARLKDRVSPDVLAEVRGKILALIG